MSFFSFYNKTIKKAIFIMLLVQNYIFGVSSVIGFYSIVKKSERAISACSDVVAGVGFEPHDLRVMSPTSYQAALPRDIDLTLPFYH